MWVLGALVGSGIVILVVGLIHRRRKLSADVNTQLSQLGLLLATKVEKVFALAFVGQFSGKDLEQAQLEFAALERARKCIRLDRIVGQGQSGQVHLGTLDGKICAIKVAGKLGSFSTLQGDTSAEESLQLEARLLVQLKHPCIIRVAGVITQSLPSLVCLEYMANGDLKTLLRCV